MATAQSVPDDVASLIDQFPDDVDLDEEAIINRYEEMVNEYRVPSDEAVLTTRNYFLDEYGLEYGDLAGNNGRTSGPADTQSLADVTGPDMWLSTTAKVLELWENDKPSIAQVGLIGDASGTIKLTIWESADAPTIAEGEVYEFENLVSDEYQSHLSVQVNSASTITHLDDVDPNDFEVGTEAASASGVLVAVQPGSGLIKRCPEEDCTRVLQNGRCSEHGKVDGEFDLRIKAVIDDGTQAVNAIFDQEATKDLTGLTLEEAKQEAMDALDTSVVEDAIKEQVLGHAYAIHGPVIGQYLIVNNCKALSSLGDDTDFDGVAPGNAVNGGREVAKRVFAQEFNNAITTFTESDEERAPVYALLPSGEKANRVYVVGTLTETEDVGSDSEYWRGRVVGSTGTFFVYAGQYQPEAMNFLRSAETPQYVAVVGKPRTYETDNGTNVSIRPESMTVVDGDVRDYWVAQTAMLTGARLDGFDPDADVNGEERNYAAMAKEVYDPDLDAYEAMIGDARADLEDDVKESSGEEDDAE